MPLTKEQFQKAREAGFSVDQIVEFEKKRSGSANEEYGKKFIPQLTKGLYESVPFGKRVISMMPNREQIEDNLASTPEPTTLKGKFGRVTGDVSPDIAMASPFLQGAGLIPKVPGIIKAGIGLGAYSGTKAAVTGEDVVPASLGGFGSGVLFGGLGKLGASIIPKQIPGAERIGSALGGAVAGAITAEPGKEADNALMMAGLGAVVPSKRFTGKGRYTKSKVLEIRQKTRDFHKQEVKKYGEGIKNLPNEKFDGANAIEKYEQALLNKGIITPDGRVKQNLTTQESKQYKAYQRLYRKFADSPKGEIELKDIIDEYQNIKGKTPKVATSTSRANIQAADELLDTVKDNIKSDAWKKINSDYRTFKQKEQAIDKYFDIWGSEYLTGKGERTLINLFEPERGDVGRLATEVTGVGLKGAKLRSLGKAALDNPLLRWGLLGGGLYSAGRAMQE